ncbi:MAG: ABC transporter ATP-binding protein [Pseudomonadales bacterium]|nr:ABC transporter ATP-binding protein [Pseudomonadales bacterium]
MTKALVIRDLTKVYAGGVEALKGINLDVEQGDFFGLLGPNGAGKSTTLSIITSLVNKTSGTVEVFGYDIDTHFSQAKKHLGVVPQEFNFSQFEKVFDIVVTQGGYYGIPLALAKQRAEHYLKKIGLWDKRHTQARMLSGGMKRRLMIARALVHEPNVLILDEPTAGVDIELRRSMWEFLREINAQGVTIILTTHYLEEAESLCRNIAIIDKGKIIQDSNTRALLRQLNMETFIFDVVNELTLAPEISGYASRLIDSHCFEVMVVKNQGLNPIFESLSAQGIQVSSMRNKANRLEELFVSLVEQGRMT